MDKENRRLWEAADSLLGGQLFLEEEEMEMDMEDVKGDEEEEAIDLDEPMPDMPSDEDEEGLTPSKIMSVIDDVAAESEEETEDEFLKNLSAELEDDVKMDSLMKVIERLFEDMEQDDMSDEELEDTDVEDIDLPDEDEI